MARRCPECDAPVDGAPWCGACGARVPITADGVSSGATGGGTAPPRERPWLRRTTGLVVLGALGTLLVVGGGDPAPPVPATPADALPDGEVLPPVLLSDRAIAGRQFAPRGSVLWSRTDLVSPSRAGGVTPAGSDHLLVSGNLLWTGDGPAGEMLDRLPVAAASGAFDPSGQWAVAEFGRVVLGGTTPTVQAVVPDGWRPTGSAVAWHLGAPVLRDDAGHLGLLGDDGAPRWRTPEPVSVVGPVGAAWAAGVRVDGRPVVVALADGHIVDLPAPALAILGDLVVTRPDDVVAVDAATGSTVWRRAAEARTWRAVGGALVAESVDAAVRVDPATGTDRDRVEGADLVAGEDVVLVRAGDRLEAVAWSGASRWRLRLAAGATVLAVDDERVAVLVGPPAGARLTVYESATGLVVADTVLPASDDRALSIRGEELWVIASGAPVAVVDRRSGADVTSTAMPTTGTGVSLEFRAGGRTVMVTAGVATLRGTSDGSTLWTMPLDAPLIADPAPSGTSVLALLADGTVVSVNPGTGELRWRSVLDVAPTAVASDGMVLLVGTDDGQVLRLDPSGDVVTRTVAGTGPVQALVAGRPAAALLGDRLVGLDVDG